MMLIPMQEKSQKKLPRVRGVVQSTPPLTESPTGTPCSVVSVYGKDISTPAERKKMSRVRIGRRHSQVAAIDNLMDEYWQLGDHWTTTNCNEKSIKLYMMLEQIQDHISSKRTSDRRAAVIKLGREILEVIKDKADDGQEFKDALLGTVGRELM